ncbi:hypothetical protein ACN47E_003988 [Coniothyrium glycines]
MRPLTTFLALAPLASLAFGQTLEIDVTRKVECTRKSQNGDKLSMMYKGTLQSDGSKFDSSYDRGQPFKFKLGAGQVISGWDQGLLDMCIGEARKLTIPPNMAYGNSDMGKIPPGSTLIFETELLGIDGVKAETVPERPAVPSKAPSAEPPATSPLPVSEEDKATDTEEAAPVVPSGSAAEVTALPEPAKANGKPTDKNDNGECNLLGDFALLVQGALGLLAVSSLAIKRLRESPRRPLKIWFFDVSKQVFGSVLLHLANILMSMLSSGKFDVAATTAALPKHAGTNDAGEQPNPCSFYLLNLAIDTTIGIPILVLLLKILHRAFSLTPLANPPESIRSGNYGHPPRASWWLKQSIIYFLGLIGMKLCVLAIFAFLPWIAWVGDWALRWTEGSEALQITFVMFIFPLIMNALQYWIIDNFIKDPEQGESQYVIAADDDTDDDTDEDWLERQRRRREQGIDGDEDSDVEVAARDTLKEANPTAVPARAKKTEDYDPASDGAGSSRSKSRKD